MSKQGEVSFRLWLASDDLAHFETRFRVFLGYWQKLNFACKFLVQFRHMNDQPRVGPHTFAAQPQQAFRDILHERLVIKISRQSLVGCVQADIFF